LSALGPVRQLCAIRGVSRSWYDAAQAATVDEAAVALRAASEEMVLAFPGYG
jgi:hypothetical protein